MSNFFESVDAKLANSFKSDSKIGENLLKFRKDSKLTQMDLAKRYKVTGPAIFKLEKGYLAPSLPLWLKMSNDMGISEKEALLMWIRDKLPPRHRNLIQPTQEFNRDSFRKELEASAKAPYPMKQRRAAVLGNPEISSSLKKFISDDQTWEVLKPSINELVFLAELDNSYPRISAAQFREAMIVAREIQSSSEQ